MPTHSWKDWRQFNFRAGSISRWQRPHSGSGWNGGEAPDGLRYLARRQTVGQIPEGWNVPVLMYHAVGDEI